MDELWNALPTLRKVTASVGWEVIQRVTWDKLFKSLLGKYPSILNVPPMSNCEVRCVEPDMLQYPVTLLTAAALIDSLVSALESRFKREDEASICNCKESAKTPVSKCILDENEQMAQHIRQHEAIKLSCPVIMDIRDVLHLSEVRRLVLVSMLANGMVCRSNWINARCG